MYRISSYPLETKYFCDNLLAEGLFAVAFKLYDLRQTGYIEREEVNATAILLFPLFLVSYDINSPIMLFSCKSDFVLHFIFQPASQINYDNGSWR